MSRKTGSLRTLIALTLLFIWGHSLMSAATSMAESGTVGRLLEKLLPEGEAAVTIVRKGAHMLEYAFLSAELTLLKGETAFPRRLFGTLSFCGLAALIDETLQYIPVGRGPAVTDVWIDLAGALFGALFVSLLLSVRTGAGRKRG